LQPGSALGQQQRFGPSGALPQLQGGMQSALVGRPGLPGMGGPGLSGQQLPQPPFGHAGAQAGGVPSGARGALAGSSLGMGLPGGGMGMGMPPPRPAALGGLDRGPALGLQQPPGAGGPGMPRAPSAGASLGARPGGYAQPGPGGARGGAAGAGGPPGGLVPPHAGNSGSELLAMIKQGGGGAGSGSSQSLGGSSHSLGALVAEPGPAEGRPFSLSEFPQLGGSRPGSGSSLLGLGGGLGLEEGLYGKGGEFSIASEDFPALPGGAPGGPPARAPGPAQPDELYEAGYGAPPGAAYAALQAAARGAPRAAPAAAKPPGERYGLLGLLAAIRMSDADLSTLALGTDLTTLGLNLNSPEPLHKTFAGPWADAPCRPEPELGTPAAYLQQPPYLTAAILARFSPESLFYVFYSCPGEEAQLAAAEELVHRGWVWHKELKAWLVRAPSSEPPGKAGSGERGSFLVFDPNSWEKRLLEGGGGGGGGGGVHF